MRKILLVGLAVLLTALAAWGRPLVVAHRGGAALGKENSLRLFQKALELGVDAIELDIHQSADGHLVVLHDVSLKRTHGLDRRVDQMNLAELGRAGVPTLQEAIDTIDGRCILLVEVKHPAPARYQGIEKRLHALLKKNDLLKSVVVISFDTTTLKLLHKLEPTLKTGYLYATPGVSPVQAKARFGVTYLCPYYRFASIELIDQAHAAGLKINAWTVNDEPAMEKLVQSGCDAVTTDHPDLLQKMLGPISR